MFCWKCGHKHAESHKFCPECGAKQLSPEQVEPDSERLRREQEADERLARDRARINPADPQKTPISSPISMEPRHPEPISPVIQEPDRVNPVVEEPRSVRESVFNLNAPPEPDTRTSANREYRSESRGRQPRISGPSLLGLSDEPDLSDDDSSYLFDDQPVERSTWRAWTLLIILLVFGFLAYKHWTTVSGAAKNFADRAGKEIAAQNAEDAAQKKNGGDPTAAAKDPATDSKLQTSGGGDPNEAASQAGKPEIKDDTGSASGTTADTANSSKDGSKDASGKDKPVESAELNKPESDESSANPDKDSKDSTKSDKPTPDKATNAGRNAAAATPKYDNSEVELAQKYLQGRGVPQSCERGLSLLQSAARTENPRASIQMGALYASGHCVSQDRAEAYKWFAKAHREEPNNMWIERNLNSLWANMTPQERNRAER